MSIIKIAFSTHNVHERTITIINTIIGTAGKTMSAFCALLALLPST